MFKFVKAILGIGAKKTKTSPKRTQTRKAKTRVAIERDYVEEAVSETVFAVRAEQASAKTRYRHLDDRTLDRIIREAINDAHHDARTKARSTATHAADQGKGRIYILRVGNESARETYRKAIDRAIQAHKANSKPPKKAKPSTSRNEEPKQKSTAALPIAEIRNAAIVERAAAKERYKDLNLDEIDTIIQGVLSRIDIVWSGKKSPRDVFRNAFDTALEAHVDKLKDEREATKAATRKPGIPGRSSKNDRNAGRPNRAHKTKEEKKIHGELETLQHKRRLLKRTMRDVTFRGGKKSKNADFHDTREQLIAIEERIQFYEEALARPKNTRSKRTNEIVQVGSTVLIRYDDSYEDEIYRIVMTPLFKGSESTISANSPTGSALLGKRKGDKVRVQTPDGNVRLRVVEVR